MDYEISDRLRNLIAYLGSSKLLSVDKQKIVEDLRIPERDVEANLNYGVNLGLINVELIVYCDECGEDIEKIKALQEVLGKEKTCWNCGKTFVVTEDHILQYYSLTFKGIDFYTKSSKKQHFLIPRFNLFPYFVDKKI